MTPQILRAGAAPVMLPTVVVTTRPSPSRIGPFMGRDRESGLTSLTCVAGGAA